MLSLDWSSLLAPKLTSPRAEAKEWMHVWSGRPVPVYDTNLKNKNVCKLVFDRISVHGLKQPRKHQPSNFDSWHQASPSGTSFERLPRRTVARATADADRLPPWRSRDSPVQEQRGLVVQDEWDLQGCMGWGRFDELPMTPDPNYILLVSRSTPPHDLVFVYVYSFCFLAPGSDRRRVRPFSFTAILIRNSTTQQCLADGAAIYSAIYFQCS